MGPGGFEPPTSRLSAGRSTAELRAQQSIRRSIDFSGFKVYIIFSKIFANAGLVIRAPMLIPINVVTAKPLKAPAPA